MSKRCKVEWQIFLSCARLVPTTTFSLVTIISCLHGISSLAADPFDFGVLSIAPLSVFQLYTLGCPKCTLDVVTVCLKWGYSFHRVGTWKGHSPQSRETCFYASMFYCLCMMLGISLYLSKFEMLLFKDKWRSCSRSFPLSQSVFHRKMIWWDTRMHLLVPMPFWKNEASGNPCNKWIWLTF